LHTIMVSVHSEQQRMNHKDSKTQRKPITDDACETGNGILKGAFVVYCQGVPGLQEGIHELRVL